MNKGWRHYYQSIIKPLRACKSEKQNIQSYRGKITKYSAHKGAKQNKTNILSYKWLTRSFNKKKKRKKSFIFNLQITERHHHWNQSHIPLPFHLHCLSDLHYHLMFQHLCRPRGRCNKRLWIHHLDKPINHNFIFVV